METSFGDTGWSQENDLYFIYEERRNRFSILAQTRCFARFGDGWAFTAEVYIQLIKFGWQV